MKKLLITLATFSVLAAPALVQAEQYNDAQRACQVQPITCKSNAPAQGFKCSMTYAGKTYALGGVGVAEETVKTQLKQQCSVANATK